MLRPNQSVENQNNSASFLNTVVEFIYISCFLLRIALRPLNLSTPSGSGHFLLEAHPGLNLANTHISP